MLFEGLTLSPVLYIAFPTLNVRCTQRLHHFSCYISSDQRRTRFKCCGDVAGVCALWPRRPGPADRTEYSNSNNDWAIGGSNCLAIVYLFALPVYLLCGGWTLIHIACGALAQTMMWMLTQRTAVARSYRTLQVSPDSFSVSAPKVERSSSFGPLRPSLQMSPLREDSATFFALRPRVFVFWTPRIARFSVARRHNAPSLWPPKSTFFPSHLIPHLCALVRSHCAKFLRPLVS
jgi:hypothetical protein